MHLPNPQIAYLLLLELLQCLKVVGNSKGSRTKVTGSVYISYIRLSDSHDQRSGNAQVVVRNQGETQLY